MTIDEQIAILQAAKDGKTIERVFLTGDSDTGWKPVTPDEQFNFAMHKYRVKREPKMLYVNEYENWFTTHTTREVAITQATPMARRIAVPYREVIE